MSSHTVTYAHYIAGRGDQVLQILMHLSCLFMPWFNPAGRDTIKRLIGEGPLGQRNGLSPKDAAELNRYYECNGEKNILYIR